MSKWSLLWRISSTSAGLATGHLFARGIPAPTSHRYRTFAATTPQSQGGIARQGYINVTVLWAELDAIQLQDLNDIVEAAITAGSLYLTLPKNNATGLAEAFIDIHGIAQPLEFEQIARTEGIIYENVQLVATNLTVDADPSTVFA